MTKETQIQTKSELLDSLKKLDETRRDLKKETENLGEATQRLDGIIAKREENLSLESELERTNSPEFQKGLSKLNHVSDTKALLSSQTKEEVDAFYKRKKDFVIDSSNPENIRLIEENLPFYEQGFDLIPQYFTQVNTSLFSHILTQERSRNKENAENLVSKLGNDWVNMRTQPEEKLEESDIVLRKDGIVSKVREELEDLVLVYDHKTGETAFPKFDSTQRVSEVKGDTYKLNSETVDSLSEKFVDKFISEFNQGTPILPTISESFYLSQKSGMKSNPEVADLFAQILSKRGGKLESLEKKLKTPQKETKKTVFSYISDLLSKPSIEESFIDTNRKAQQSDILYKLVGTKPGDMKTLNQIVRFKSYLPRVEINQGSLQKIICDETITSLAEPTFEEYSSLDEIVPSALEDSSSIVQEKRVNNDSSSLSLGKKLGIGAVALGSSLLFGVYTANKQEVHNYVSSLFTKPVVEVPVDDSHLDEFGFNENSIIPGTNDSLPSSIDIPKSEIVSLESTLIDTSCILDGVDNVKLIGPFSYKNGQIYEVNTFPELENFNRDFEHISPVSTTEYLRTTNRNLRSGLVKIQGNELDATLTAFDCLDEELQPRQVEYFNNFNN